MLPAVIRLEVLDYPNLLVLFILINLGGILASSHDLLNRFSNLYWNHREPFIEQFYYLQRTRILSTSFPNPPYQHPPDGLATHTTELLVRSDHRFGPQSKLFPKIPVLTFFHLTVILLMVLFVDPTRSGGFWFSVFLLYTRTFLHYLLPFTLTILLHLLSTLERSSIYWALGSSQDIWLGRCFTYHFQNMASNRPSFWAIISAFPFTSPTLHISQPTQKCSLIPNLVIFIT